MNTHTAQKTQELTEMIQTLVQEFMGIHQTLNAGHVDMSKQELNIVGIVGRRGSAIMREIAEEARLAVSSVTPIIDRLVEKKVVTRKRTEEDRRIVRVELTEKGLKVFDLEQSSYLRLSEHILRVLSDEEQETFLRHFRKVSKALALK